MTGFKLKARFRKRARLNIASGAAQTCWLELMPCFNDSVDFDRLALAIIVWAAPLRVHQRMLYVDEKAWSTVSATPIWSIDGDTHSSYLAMSLMDLDCSIIDELPPGRTPVKIPLFVSIICRQEVIVEWQGGCEEGKQAYWGLYTLMKSLRSAAAKPQKTPLSLLTETSLAIYPPPPNWNWCDGSTSHKKKATIMSKI